jgi:hypothetical protein
MDPNLHVVNIGLNAEVFASVASLGDARDENGNALDVSDAAMKVLPGETTLTLQRWWGGSWSTKRYFRADGWFIATGRTSGAGDTKPSTSKDCTKLGLQNSGSHAEASSFINNEPPTAMKSMILMVGALEQKGSLGAFAPGFSDMWSVILRNTFETGSSDGQLTPTGEWNDKKNDPFFSTTGTRASFQQNGIRASHADFQHWQLDALLFTYGGGLQTFINKAAFIRGVEYRVKDTSTLQLIWNAGACKSELSWVFDVCKKCECTMSNGQKGLIENTVSHTMDSTSTGGAACSDFFVRYDKAFREYMATMRAAILSIKNVCCTSDNWSSNVVSAISGKTYSPQCHHPARTVHDIQFKEPYLSGTTAVVPPNNHAGGDAMSSASVGLCPVMLQNDNKGNFCQSQHMPAPTGSTSSATPSFDLIHSGHSDKTLDHADKFDLTCIKHAYVFGPTLTSTNPSNMRAAWKSLDFEGEWIQWLTDRARFGGMVICSEGPTDGSTSDIGGSHYPDAARMAFALNMGQRYFSPHVVKGATSTKTTSNGVSKTVEFEIGCGGLAAGAQSLDVYMTDKSNSVLTGYAGNTDARDPDGNLVAGKPGAIKFDGGKSPLAGAPCSQSGNCDPSAAKNTEGLAYRRRRGNTPGWIPTWHDSVGMRNSQGNWGEYRPKLGGTSSTCCPPKALPAQPDQKMLEKVPESGDWRGMPWDLATPCFRGIYGETQSCRSKLYLHISECDDCTCVQNGNRVLVNVGISHGLITSKAACKPWFTQADAAIRAYIAVIREDVVKQKLASC